MKQGDKMVSHKNAKISGVKCHDHFLRCARYSNMENAMIVDDNGSSWLQLNPELGIGMSASDASPCLMATASPLGPSPSSTTPNSPAAIRFMPRKDSSDGGGISVFAEHLCCAQPVTLNTSLSATLICVHVFAECGPF